MRGTAASGPARRSHAAGRRHGGVADRSAYLANATPGGGGEQSMLLANASRRGGGNPPSAWTPGVPSPLTGAAFTPFTPALVNKSVRFELPETPPGAQTGPPPLGLRIARLLDPAAADSTWTGIVALGLLGFNACLVLYGLFAANARSCQPAQLEGSAAVACLTPAMIAEAGCPTQAGGQCWLVDPATLSASCAALFSQ